MPFKTDKYFFSPTKDRSRWQPERDSGLSLTYLAWGRRDFGLEFLPECMHEGWVCTIIEEGSPTMVIQGKEVKLSPRQLVFIGPDCSFGWPTIDGSTCKFVQWMWHDTATEKFGGLARDAHFISEIPRGKYKPLRENHDQCRREALDLSERSDQYFKACRQLFEILIERVMSNEAHVDVAQVRIHQAQEWMRKHLDSKEPIARLCDYLDVSQSTLHRLFKSQLNQSALTHFQELRMREARSALVMDQQSIKEVAYFLGYNHLNDFSRAYKSHYGCPPSKHQK
ncbi:MAG: helix-turn-helix transcriptional regulator [Lentimonas sp.]